MLEFVVAVVIGFKDFDSTHSLTSKRSSTKGSIKKSEHLKEKNSITKQSCVKDGFVQNGLSDTKKIGKMAVALQAAKNGSFANGENIYKVFEI